MATTERAESTTVADGIYPTRRGFRQYLATAAKFYVFVNSAVFFTAFFWTLSERLV